MSYFAVIREALPAGSYLAPACGARRFTPGGATG